METIILSIILEHINEAVQTKNMGQESLTSF